MIKQVSNLVYSMLPSGRLHRRDNIKLVSTVFVLETLYSERVRRWGMTQVFNDTGYTVEIEFTSEENHSQQFVDGMIERKALWQLDQVELNSGALNTVRFMCGSNRYHQKNGFCYNSNDERYQDQIYDELGNGMHESLLLGGMLITAMQGTDPDVLRWFTDRLAHDEHSSPALLQLQNFMYRFANVQ